MKYFLQKKKFANNFSASSLLLALTLASPQVLAQDAANQRIRQLENALQQIQQELANIKAEAAKTQEIQNELNRVKAESAQTTQKVERIQQASADVPGNSIIFDSKTFCLCLFPKSTQELVSTSGRRRNKFMKYR